MSSPNRVGNGKKGTFVQRLTAGLLVFLFLVTPIASVFAEELNAEVPAEQNTTGEEVMPTPVEPSEQRNEENTNNEETPGVNAPDENQMEPEPAKEPDKIRRKNIPEPNNSTGALSYEYPIPVAPGRNNMQPDLRLIYNSQATAIDSVISQGWSVSIPSIERINRTGAENLFTNDYFSSSMSDELVSLGNGNYGAKVDNGEFISYSFANNEWIAIDKQGTKYIFGHTAASRQDNPSNSSQIFKWMLNEIRDTNDNYIKYEFTKNSGQIYPSKIKYTGYGSTDGIFEIEFILQPRTDITTSTQSGFSVTTNSKIQEIQTKINGSWVKKLQLSYGLGDNGSKSVLSSVLETGKDENNNTKSLPAEYFDYQLKTKTLVEDPNWEIPLIFEYNGEKGVRMFDVNGDGLVDMIQSIKYADQSTDQRIYINNGINGWIEDRNWTIPLFFMIGTADRGVHFEDINGDGLIDLIQNSQGYQGNGVYLNNGNGTGWTLDTSWTNALPAFFISNQFNDEGVRLADINGDGLVDVVKSIKESSVNEVKQIYLNTGSDWERDLNWTIPVHFSNIGTDSGVRLVDINGDGNTDFIKSNSYSSATNGVYINNGDATGWTLSSVWSIGISFYDNFGDMGVRMADINGDGLVDLLRSQKQQNGSVIRRVYINNGSTGWSQDNAWGVDDNSVIQVDFSFGSAYNKGVDLGDVNGDGLVDVIQSWKQGVTPIQNIFISSGEKADLMSKIRISQGAETTIQYKGSPEYRDSLNNLLNPKLLFGLQTVSNISVNDSFGTTNSTSYSYANGKYYFGNYLDRKFSGFGKVTVTDDDQNVTTTSFHGGTQNEPQYGEYQDHISKMGKPYRVEVRDSNGNLYAKSINRWERHDFNDGRNFVKQTVAINFSYDGNSSHKDKAELYDFDDNGNKTEIVQLGEVNAADDGNYSDIGTDKFTTTISYTHNTSNGVIGLPVTDLIKDVNNINVSETKHYYDNLALGLVGPGNETKTQQWKDESNYVDTEKTYNSYGLVVSEKDPRDKITSYIYDSYNLFPVTVTNPLLQTTSYSYDYSSGNVKQTVDANGRNFSTVYDGLDRATEEKQPDIANPSSNVTTAIYEYTDIANAFRIKKSVYLTSTNAVDSYTYFDGLGRKIQERTKTETPSQYAVRDFEYKEGELLLKESLPYFSSGSARTSKTTTSTLYTNYNYDTLKRVSSAVTAVGTTSNNYDDWKTTITDATGKVKDVYREAYDNLVRVDEHNGTAIYTTVYEWNGLKKLTKITDALGNIRNFSYDGLGRVLSAEDLHTWFDSAYGVWSYGYDDSSNLISRLDPNGANITYAYDDLNRIITEDYNGTINTDVSYTYDTCTEGVGRLCSVANSTLLNSKVYNALGQVAQETKKIGKINYVSSYTYDRAGNQVLITNPDSSKVQYLYNAAGTIDQIQRKENSDPSFVNVINNIDYNAVGLPTVMTYANGSITTNTYDAGELYRLVHKVTSANNINVQDLTYDYDAVGNILQIVDASATQTAKTTDYTYDDLHRLLTSTITNSVAENVDGPGNGNQTQTFTYDAIGNILSKSDVGNYSYDGAIGMNFANPHAVTSTSDGLYYSYDNNGNMSSVTSITFPNARTYSWDYNNHLLAAEVNGTVSSYAYDADGQRVITNDAEGKTLSVTKEYAVTPSFTEKHIFFGDTAIATISGSNAVAEPLTIHADHLTGSNVVTDSSQAIDELTDYYAFGTMRIDEQNGSHEEKRKFTGHEYDEETGLTYANARYYNATLGRWLSQDSVFLAIANDKSIEQKTQSSYIEYLGYPQNHNSYSYVLNNPLKYKDVTGEYAETLIDIVFLGISLYDFKKNPTFGNGLFVGLDAAGVALPIPALAGYIKNGLRIGRMVNYFSNIARNGDDAFRLGQQFVKNIGFDFTKRAWSAGEAGNDIASLVGHFYKHGDEVGANSIKGYYSKANDFIDKKQFTHSWKEGRDTVYYNAKNNFINITREGGEISSFYKVTDQKKLNKINSMIKR